MINSALGRQYQGFQDINCHVVSLKPAWGICGTVLKTTNSPTQPKSETKKNKHTHTHKYSCFYLIWEMIFELWWIEEKEQFDDFPETPIHEDNQCHLDFCIFFTKSIGFWRHGTQTPNGLHVTLHLRFHPLIQPLEWWVFLAEKILSFAVLKGSATVTQTQWEPSNEASPSTEARKRFIKDQFALDVRENDLSPSCHSIGAKILDIWGLGIKLWSSCL